ncbi:hypothetical protein F5Y12DRAFT_11669 [Xylaria sp. FL1777]|nr:hypothetical protein F5Y12DRAFT_11669 [Xylaria sp. FL1777]
MSRHTGTPPSRLKEQAADDNDNDNNNNNNNNDDDNEVQSSSSSSDDAIDDTEDLPDDFVEVQKSISCERRRRPSTCVQDLFPFPYSPLVRPLSISDVESCVALENAAFANPAHRCSREKFVYRLRVCPELCMGVFCTVVPAKTKGWEIDTLHTAHVVETGREDGALSVLLAHIVATRSHDDVVTDDAMRYPHDRDDNTAESNNNNSNSNNGHSNGNGSNAKSKLGHQAFGRTICIHSLAVHPKLQGVGLGKLVLKAYMQQVKNAALADRIALICQEYLVNYYRRFGFSYSGPSEAVLAGGGWHNMTDEIRQDKTNQIDRQIPKKIIVRMWPMLYTCCFLPC